MRQTRILNMSLSICQINIKHNKSNGLVNQTDIVRTCRREVHFARATITRLSKQ